LIGAKRADRLKKIFDRMEMTEGRFRVEWISAAEGDKYARVLNEMQGVLDNMSKEDLKAEIEKLKPDMEKRLKKFPGVPGVPEAMEYSDLLSKAITDQKEAA
jgi:heterodisulfide reductase subunit A